MAKVLNNFKFAERNHAPKYDWNLLFDGQVRELKRGEDFKIATHNFRNSANIAAKKRGFKLKTMVVDENTLVIQAESDGSDG